MKVRAAEHVAACAQLRTLPPAELPEIALLGRSNVGKSSLLNRMVGRRKLARTSATPGKTRLIHFYRVEADPAPLLLVDLPGYGWARVSKKEREAWRQLVEGYLDARESLRVAVLLQDLRRDFAEDEHLLLQWLALRDVKALVAVTKTDKLKRMQRAKRLRALRDQLEAPAPAVVATSAQTGEGIRELWQALADHIY